MSEAPETPTSQYNFVMHAMGDPQQQIRMAFMPFPLPAKSARAGKELARQQAPASGRLLGIPQVRDQLEAHHLISYQWFAAPYRTSASDQCDPII